MKPQFEVLDFDSGGRIGKFILGKKEMLTPTLFPVVNPFENLIPPRKLYEHFGARALFTNAYIIYQNRKRNQHIVEQGLHQHLDFPGIIATDSGGFQDYMYGGNVKVNPADIEHFEEELQSDCPVILDIPVQTTDSYEEAKEKITITLERAKKNIKRRIRQDTAWFGPIHGSIYPDLLKYSAQEMSKLDFGIYAIGGVVKTFIDYRFDLDVKILLEVKKWIRPDRPLHMFGLGLPAFFSLAVACGADTFDSAAYILYAKDDRYFTLTGTKNVQELHELPCHCPVCTSLTANELKKLSKDQRIQKIAEHNLYLSFSELRTIRQAIREGTLWDLVEHRVHAHPKLVKALYETQHYSEYFQNLINYNVSKGQNYLCKYSFYRPIFRKFREKLKNFQIPAGKNCLVLLPELDLPTINSDSMKKWISSIIELDNLSKLQILIISDLLGPIPFQLAEMYPAGQHEGSGNMLDNLKQRQNLLNLFKIQLKFWEEKVKIAKIGILLPKTFINEYMEEEDFSLETHLIFYIANTLENQYQNLNPKKFSKIGDLIKYVK